jgi:methylated-DNA-[protein]-cysteine S-methyltransferase
MSDSPLPPPLPPPLPVALPLPATWDRVPPDLTAGFARAGLIDVAYAFEDSPLGRLLIASSSQGLLRLAYAEVDPDRVLADLAVRISPRIIAAPGRLDPVRRQLKEYFTGRRRDFDLALDRRLIRPGFSGRVLDATAQIASGAVSSYRGVAGAAGSPGAFRAAGSALGANPLPIIIPCHRVLASGGGLGGYTGGPDRKAQLLELEGAYFRA